MIRRSETLARLRSLLQAFPVVGILGARQVGKATLAQELCAEREERVTVLDLEHPEDVARLRQPVQALGDLRGLVVIDEVQLRPDLFAVLRVLVDSPENHAHFLVLGSASGELLRQSSESLAGRIAYLDLHGFDLSEIGPSLLDRLWIRGGFPRSFLADSDESSLLWRQQFIRTYVERDLGSLGVKLPAQTVRRFLNMLVHVHARIWNAAAIARSMDTSEKTARHYLDIVCSTFFARRLNPWFENIGKRQVKSPKVYLRDSGILHALLDVTTRHDLLGNPKLGDSWEGLVIGEVCRRLGARDEESYFWAVHTGAELDLLVVRGMRRLGFEVKFTDSPRVTRSMRSAKEVLGLAEVVLLHPGEHSFSLDEGFRAVAMSRIDEDLQPL